ncbi:hypothetical protein, partial [Klebsiella pneumoniae]|uniref:hypothetical protein n=1 Tax=Klebsiella pneumoniae TaxID=573 RepID=UPI0030138BAC
MSYHKTSLGSKDGTNGTTHVAQFHPVPGFTCFVDETTPQKTEADKPNPSLKNDIRRQVDFCEGVLEG